MDASKLKKRILEMKTKRKQKLAWLLVVPMLGLAGTTVSFVNPEKTVESGISKLDDSIVKASFKGGMDQYIAYFIKEVKYPETAKKQNLSGKVFVEFTVKKDGSISDSNIQKSTTEIFNKEALRVVNAMPKWNPATKEGKAVNSKMVVPIQFKL
jgi:TonB family protein